MKLLSSVALLALFSLVACGGGSSSSSTVPAPVIPHNTAAKTAKLAVSFKIPSKKTVVSSKVLRRPKYVSLGTTQANVVLNGGTPVALSCTPVGNPAACSGTVDAQIGLTTITVNLLDGANTLLATGTTLQQIAAGPNTVEVTANGVVQLALLTTDFTTLSFTVGTPSSINISFAAYDPDGFAITGLLGTLAFQLYDSVSGDAGHFTVVPASTFTADSTATATVTITYDGCPVTPDNTPGADAEPLSVALYPTLADLAAGTNRYDINWVHIQPAPSGTVFSPSCPTPAPVPSATPTPPLPSPSPIPS